ncbi:hypothetical protein B0T14DRAFT_570342 [Immersiella caudata]|uniref:Uncharacterized protein n=1 Tax=Immersiella caudata TaxID=314043 RepID=A0AA40BUS0_9PEZI|nr:hypothetical protein B0T14DRAFT_570342 [Immersiella caudata]
MASPFTIRAGNAIGGGVDFSTSTLKVTGGKSEAPEATAEQLKKLLKNLGVEDIRIGGAKADGVNLDLGEEVPDCEAASATVAGTSEIRSGDAEGGEIRYCEGNKVEVTGGIGHSSKVRLPELLKAMRLMGATGIVVEGGVANGAAIGTR